MKTYRVTFTDFTADPVVEICGEMKAQDLAAVMKDIEYSFYCNSVSYWKPVGKLTAEKLLLAQGRLNRGIYLGLCPDTGSEVFAKPATARAIDFGRIPYAGEILNTLKFYSFNGAYALEISEEDSDNTAICVVVGLGARMAATPWKITESIPVCVGYLNPCASSSCPIAKRRKSVRAVEIEQE